MRSVYLKDSNQDKMRRGCLVRVMSWNIGPPFFQETSRGCLTLSSKVSLLMKCLSAFFPISMLLRCTFMYCTYSTVHTMVPLFSEYCAYLGPLSSSVFWDTREQ